LSQISGAVPSKHWDEKMQNGVGMRMIFRLGLAAVLLCTGAAYGEFRFHVDSTVIYDDNYLREEDGEDSFLFIERAAGSYILDTYKTQLRTEGRVGGYLFTADEDRSFLSYTHTLDVAYNITDFTVGAVEGSFVVSDNPRDTDLFGDDTAWQTYIGGTVTPHLRSHLFGDKVIAFCAATGSFRDYENTRSDDWEHLAGRAGLEGLLGDRTSVIVDGELGMKDYNEASDYDYWKARTGLRRQFNEGLGVEVYAGYERRDYASIDPDTALWNTDPNERGGEGDETDTVLLGGKVEGSLGLGEFTDMTLTLVNEIEDSIQYTGEYYMNRGGDLAFKHELMDKTQIYLSIYYFNRDYQNQDRNDDRLGGFATVRYLALDWLGVSLGYARDERFSDVELSDYSQNRVWVTGDVTF